LRRVSDPATAASKARRPPPTRTRCSRRSEAAACRRRRFRSGIFGVDRTRDLRAFIARGIAAFPLVADRGFGSAPNSRVARQRLADVRLADDRRCAQFAGSARFDAARGRRCARRRAGDVGRRHEHTQRRAKVSCGDDVGRLARAVDVLAFPPQRVAPLPLVGVGERRRAAPAAAACAQRLPSSSVPEMLGGDVLAGLRAAIVAVGAERTVL
jgi:hypothetical protein